MVDNTQIVVEPQPEVQAQKEPVPFFNREPVLILAFVRAALLLAIGYGFEMSPENMALTMAFVESLLALWTRQQVTPFVAAGTTPNVQNPASTPLVK
jgi:hypothetical protein